MFVFLSVRNIICVSRRQRSEDLSASRQATRLLLSDPEHKANVLSPVSPRFTFQSADKLQLQRPSPAKSHISALCVYQEYESPAGEYAAQCAFLALPGCAGMTDSCAHAWDNVIPQPANREAENLAPGSSWGEDGSSR